MEAKFFKGIDILSENYENYPWYDVTHDGWSVFFPKTDKPIDKETYCRLVEIGWTQGESRSGIYNPDKGWEFEGAGVFLWDGK